MSLIQLQHDSSIKHSYTSGKQTVLPLYFTSSTVASLKSVYTRCSIYSIDFWYLWWIGQRSQCLYTKLVLTPQIRCQQKRTNIYNEIHVDLYNTARDPGEGTIVLKVPRVREDLEETTYRWLLPTVRLGTGAYIKCCIYSFLSNLSHLSALHSFIWHSFAGLWLKMTWMLSTPVD